LGPVFPINWIISLFYNAKAELLPFSVKKKISSRIYCVTRVENSKTQSNENLIIVMDIMGMFGLQDSENVEDSGFGAHMGTYTPPFKFVFKTY
jgi:hypothetical protein